MFSRFIIILLLLLSFDAFDLTPFARNQTISFLLFSIIGFFLFIFKYKSIDYILKQFIIVSSILFIAATINSILSLEITLIDSIIANIRFFNVYSSVFFYFVILKANTKLKYLQNIFVGLIWVNFLAYIIVNFFELPLIVGNSIFESTKLSKFFIFFGLIYYFDKLLIKNHLLNSIYFLTIFIGLNLYKMKRMLILILALLFSILSSFHIKSKKLVIVITVITFGVIFTINNYFNIYSTDEIEYKFTEAFKIFNYESELIFDSSTMARVHQIQLALSNFAEEPIFGHGIFRSSQKDLILGDTYFFYADIGVLGVLYALGMVGILYYLYQIKIIYNLKRIFYYNSFIRSLYVFLILLALYTLGVGDLVFSPYHFSAILVILLIYSKEEKSKFDHN